MMTVRKPLEAETYLQSELCRCEDQDVFTSLAARKRQIGPRSLFPFRHLE